MAHCLAAGHHRFNNLMAGSSLQICAVFLMAIAETYLDCFLDNGRADAYCSSLVEANLPHLGVPLKRAALS